MGLKKAVSILFATMIASSFIGVSHAAESDGVHLSPGDVADLGDGVQIQILSEGYGEPRGSSRAKRDSAPHCIYAYKSKGAIQVQNDCPDGWRVKVVLRYAGDTTCKWVEPGTRTNIGFNPTAAIDGVELC